MANAVLKKRFRVFKSIKVTAYCFLTLYMPSYLFPSSGLYFECFRPLQFLTTRTGFPCFQPLDSAPFLSRGALQLEAKALNQIHKNCIHAFKDKTSIIREETKTLRLIFNSALGILSH